MAKEALHAVEIIKFRKIFFSEIANQKINIIINNNENSDLELEIDISSMKDYSSKNNGLNYIYEKFLKEEAIECTCKKSQTQVKSTVCLEGEYIVIKHYKK